VEPLIARANVVVDGLTFPECPRWRDSKLWFSDMFGQRVLTLDANNRVETVVELDDRPAGLGFLPDGRALVVLRDSRQVVTIEAGTTRPHADLSALTELSLNDMVVDARGRAYVGCYVREDRGASASDCIAFVDTDGSVSVAAEGISVPNGMALLPDGNTFVCAETLKKRIVKFTIEANGLLAQPQVFAETEVTPDGICVDAEGCVWLGGLEASEFLRISEGGRVMDTIAVGERWALACALGGEDGRTLFMATAEARWPVGTNARGFIEACRVDVPGSGSP
jgi:sugar lactone lactonase YvrE